MLNTCDLLAEICLDSYLLARSGMADECLPEGRAWERSVAELLWRPGLSRRQYAGATALFDHTSHSGSGHELDACGRGWAGCLILECKAKKGGVDKADVATFHLKVFDFYCGNLREARDEQWWCLMVSASSVKNSVRRLCMQHGIILCDPDVIPLPVLVRIAGHPVSDQYLPEAKLREMVRLGERACHSMQERWRPEPRNDVSFQTDLLCSRDLDDLVWLQQELTEDLLDLYDRLAPGRLERRAERLYTRLSAVKKDLFPRR